MTSRQLAEWEAFFCLEPWGDEDRQYGLLAAVIANSNPFRKRGKMFQPGDFLMRHHPDSEPEPQTESTAVAKTKTQAEQLSEQIKKSFRIYEASRRK